MKNQGITSAFKKGLLNTLIIGVSLMGMSFINPKPAANTYQIVSSSIFIAGNGQVNDWKLTVETSKFEGNFITEGNQLEDINGFRFSFPIPKSTTSNQQGAEVLKNSLQNINCGEITFSQKQIMILPIMKSIHLVGEIKIGNNTHAVPMHMQYITQEDGTMMVYGKQFVRLSEFGINLPKDEEVTINIALKLTKQQPVIAKIRG